MSAREELRYSPTVRSQLLEGLPPSDRDLVIGSATRKRFSAHSLITLQGNPADRLYLLVRGSVRLFHTTSDGRKIMLLWLAPGDTFGAVTMLASESLYIMSSEAVKDSEVLVWDRATFRACVEKFPRILDNAITVAAGYIEWYIAAHVALTCHTARERLAHVLLGLSRSIGEKVPGGVEIIITNQELADAANITPYTASRLMSGWQKNRAVTKGRGKVVLRSADRLLLTIV
jgi:CRP/FNR family transcriptional regulator, nitrogen oxide reductase regulator